MLVICTEAGIIHGDHGSATSYISNHLDVQEDHHGFEGFSFNDHNDHEDYHVSLEISELIFDRNHFFPNKSIVLLLIIVL